MKFMADGIEAQPSFREEKTSSKPENESETLKEDYLQGSFPERPQTPSKPAIEPVTNLLKLYKMQNSLGINEWAAPGQEIS